MLFLIYENSLKDPLQYVQSVYRFLEVDDQFSPPSLEKKIHPSYKPCFNLLEKIIYRRSLKLKALKNFWLNKKISAATIKMLYRLNKRKDLPTPTIIEREKLKLYFQPEIKELEKLINRPLTEWL